jgi:NitT/TauT family transport system ATP-binding protein
VKRIVEVALPRPRDPAAPEFAAVLRELNELVQEEQRRHERDEAAR